MAETAPYIVAALLAAGCWWFGLARLGVFTSDEVRAWCRLAGLRGYALPRSRIDKAVQRAGWLEHLQTELDLERLLGRVAPHLAAGHAGRRARSVSRRRGEVVPSPLADKAIATVHPSSILRGENREAQYREFVRDLEQVAKLIAGAR